MDTMFAGLSTKAVAPSAPRSSHQGPVPIGGPSSNRLVLSVTHISLLMSLVPRMVAEAIAGVSCTLAADAEPKHGAQTMVLHGGSAAGATTSQMATPMPIASCT